MGRNDHGDEQNLQPILHASAQGKRVRVPGIIIDKRGWASCGTEFENVSSFPTQVE